MSVRTIKLNVIDGNKHGPEEAQTVDEPTLVDIEVTSKHFDLLPTIQNLIEDTMVDEDEEMDMSIPLNTIRSTSVLKILEYLDEFCPPNRKEIDNLFNEKVKNLPTNHDVNDIRTTEFEDMAGDDEKLKNNIIDYFTFLKFSHLINKNKKPGAENVVDIKTNDYDVKFQKIAEENKHDFFDIFNAADYLGFNYLQHKFGKFVAREILVGKSPDELRKWFEEKNNLKPEQLEKVQKQWDWVCANSN